MSENAAKIGRFYVPMQQAMHKLWNTYSDAELQLLLRFAKEGYKAALQATEVLNTFVNDGVKTRAALKAPKPRRAR